MKKLMLLLPVLAGVMWGSAGIFVRTYDAFGFDNITMIVIRTLTAAVLLFAGIFVFDKSMLKIKPADIWVFAACGVFGVIGLNLCYNVAIAQLKLSLAAVLLSTSPVFVMILASIVLKEKITLKKVGCTALAVLGCVLVSGALEPGGGITLSVIGVLAGVTSAVFYAVYSIFSKIAMKKKYNVFTITFYSIAISTVMLMPFADWHIMGEFIGAAPVGNSVFVFLNAFCASVFPYILYTWSLSYVDTGKVSILASGGEPSAAMIFGLLFFHEMPTVISVCGLAVTILALWLLCRPDRSSRPDRISEADRTGGPQKSASERAPGGMQGYNCIMVYSRDGQRLLFCKRLKDPYEGKYNLVGGKIEPGEDGFDAAYRELCEETGITRSQIELRHMMDFTYYNQNCYVEIYTGRLRDEVALRQETHPLCWLEEGEDFFDMKKFAGEGNIGHMVEQVKQYGEGRKAEIRNT